MVKPQAPRKREVRRPQRSAIAPVGTSAITSVIQKSDSIRATWVSDMPRPSIR